MMNPLPTRQADGSWVPWQHAGDWDTPARRVNGRPSAAVERAFKAAFARAVEVGLSLVDAREHAETAADREAVKQRARLRKVCSWCNRVLDQGAPGATTTHTMCPDCEARVNADLDRLEEEER